MKILVTVAKVVAILFAAAFIVLIGNFLLAFVFDIHRPSNVALLGFGILTLITATMWMILNALSSRVPES